MQAFDWGLSLDAEAWSANGVIADAKISRLAMSAGSNVGSVPVDYGDVVFDTFDDSDIGKPIHVQGAGTDGAPLLSTIATVAGPRSVTLADTASTTTTAKWDDATSAVAVWGTDNTATLQAALSQGGEITLPYGNPHPRERRRPPMTTLERRTG